MHNILNDYQTREGRLGEVDEIGVTDDASMKRFFRIGTGIIILEALLAVAIVWVLLNLVIGLN